MKNNLIGKKQFTEKNQKDFANISCDYNPIHIDPLIARRLIPGRCIVHGVNILLTGLNFLFKKKVSFEFNKIRFVLFNPVHIGEKIYFIKKIKNQNLIVSVKNNAVVFAEIVLGKGQQNQSTESHIRDRYLNKINIVKKNNRIKKFTGIKKNKQNYEINLKNFGFSQKYACTKNILRRNQFKTILSLSYFVGMVCPGLNSILSSIEINFSNIDANNNKINFFVEKFYKGINLIKIKFLGNMHGEIKVFLHPGYILQPSIKKIRELIRPKEFIGINSLIIGGSRGLGELTSKILTSGEGDVNITYFRGRKEALKLKKVIKFETKKNCKVEKLDVLGDNFTNKIKKFTNYDFIFYYATPKIFRKKIENFDRKIFKDFYKYYVKRFILMCNLLDKKINKKLVVFFPSTVFIKKTPRYLKEYAKAKLIAEKLIKRLNNRFSKLKVVVIRLPKLKTDQTSEVITSFKNENIEIMVPIIRSIITRNL